MSTNIRKTNKLIRIKGIEGNTLDIVEEGDLLGYGQVYYIITQRWQKMYFLF
jgi:hypothetical protein